MSVLYGGDYEKIVKISPKSGPNGKKMYTYRVEGFIKNAKNF